MIGKTMMGGHGKYRMRTGLRALLPCFLAERIPKGLRDCGDHEWYRSDDGTSRCYHCEVGILRPGKPYRPRPAVRNGVPAANHPLLSELPD